jgi:hypothetical protein
MILKNKSKLKTAFTGHFWNILEISFTILKNAKKNKKSGWHFFSWLSYTNCISEKPNADEGKFLFMEVLQL